MLTRNSLGHFVKGSEDLGFIGAKIRAEKLSSERKKEIAIHAATVRWLKYYDLYIPPKPYIIKIFGYRQYKKDICETCGFKALYKGQLDIHHIDRNHDNNEPSNLMTLCANCHRLEHCLQRF